MILSSQNVITVCTQHRQEIAVAAQDHGLVLDASCTIPLVEYFALSNDCIGQLDWGAIQEHHVDPIPLQDTPQFMGKTSLDTPPVSRSIHQDGQITVAHWTQNPVDLGTEQVDQADALQVRQCGR
jgi:hypothetical protein